MLRWSGTVLALAVCLAFSGCGKGQDQSKAHSIDRLVQRHERASVVSDPILEDHLRVVVEERLLCFSQAFEKDLRNLERCRNHYINRVVSVARSEFDSAPDMGRFVLCMQEAPVAYGICRGEGDLLAPADCVFREVQAIEACVTDYWRGGTVSINRSAW